MIVRKGPTVLAVGTGVGGFGHFFSPLSLLSSFSPSLWETARYRLKYCLKGPLSQKQPTVNLKILCRKYLQHQQIPCLRLLKKTFDRLCIQPYGSHMYSIGVNLIHTIEQLYDKATSAVQMNGSMGEWFRKKTSE